MNVFVFGSNREGRHGAGAAREAWRNHGAINGQAYGLQGFSYAIVTKELRRNHPPVVLSEVASGVKSFLEFARAHPGDTFFVTPIGCGLAGFSHEQIAPLFRDSPVNVKLPEEFKLWLKLERDIAEMVAKEGPGGQGA